MKELAIRDFYAVVADSSLPHQLVLYQRSKGVLIGSRCNCGQAFTARRPEMHGSLDAIKSEYGSHVRAVLHAQECN